MNYWGNKTRGPFHRHVTGTFDPPVSVEFIFVTDSGGSNVTDSNNNPVTLNNQNENIAVTDTGGTPLGVDL